MPHRSLKEPASTAYASHAPGPATSSALAAGSSPPLHKSSGSAGAEQRSLRQADQLSLEGQVKLQM